MYARKQTFTQTQNLTPKQLYLYQYLSMYIYIICICLQSMNENTGLRKDVDFICVQYFRVVGFRFCGFSLLVFRVWSLLFGKSSKTLAPRYLSMSKDMQDSSRRDPSSSHPMGHKSQKHLKTFLRRMSYLHPSSIINPLPQLPRCRDSSRSPP